ncbi:hypothetical protein O181_051163, partial [Austropuccinia psidii MF-1]|nr:hypothetical protein [Austropuccinia psidii MF-1]
SHLGASLATQFMNVLHRYNLDQKIICITTDNASVNNRMAQEIEAICPRFCSKANAVGYEDNLNQMSISSLVDPPDGLHLQYNSIISKISRLASYLRHSPQRQDKFATTVNLVYENNKPGNANTLLSQVPTRWNSTYEMLNCALQLKDAYNHFCTPEALACYRLSPLEWQKANVMVQFLEPLYEATLLICGSTYPTINQALPLYILLIKSIRQVSEQYDVAPIEPAAQAMIQKISKYISIVLSKSPVICASILDPRIKQVFFATHESTLAEFHTSSLQLSKVFEDKAKKYVNNNDSEPHVNIKKTTGLLDKMYPSTSGDGCSFEKELQRYFAEPPEPKDTDILIFWKS